MLDRIRYADAADLARIAEFNRTDRAFPDRATLPGLLDARMAEHGSRIGAICDHDPSLGACHLTYREIAVRSSRLAARLRRDGVRPGRVVALMVERSAAMIVGILGILKAGGAYLPIAPDAPAERLDYMLDDCDVDVVLVQGATRSRVPAGRTVIELDDPDTYAGPTLDHPVVSSPRDLAYVIYTSGSTGRPKGVMIEQRSVINRLDWMQRAYPIGGGDVILQKTPYYFDVSVWELLWWALEGATVCFLPPGVEGNPLAIVETVRRHRVTTLHFVPSMLNVFLEYLEAKPAAVVDRLASVRRVFASGEALTPSHVRRFHRAWARRTGVRLTNLYGPTEATVDVTAFDCPDEEVVGSIPIGRPIQNTRAHVMRAGRAVAIGEVGELCISGVGLARGYVGNPSLTAERFVDNPSNPGERMYRTGDLARWLPDGNLEFLGREDQQVKIRGLRIELGEIESTIREYPGVSDCVVVMRRRSESVVQLIAHLVTSSDVGMEELGRHLRLRLPDYMIPHRFERIREIPLTPTGKANRRALAEPIAADVAV